MRPWAKKNPRTWGCLGNEGRSSRRKCRAEGELPALGKLWKSEAGQGRTCGTPPHSFHRQKGIEQRRNHCGRSGKLYFEGCRTTQAVGRVVIGGIALVRPVGIRVVVVSLIGVMPVDEAESLKKRMGRGRQPNGDQEQRQHGSNNFHSFQNVRAGRSGQGAIPAKPDQRVRREPSSRQSQVFEPRQLNDGKSTRETLRRI